MTFSSSFSAVGFMREDGVLYLRVLFGPGLMVV